METVTLILFGLAVLCFVLALINKGNRTVNLFGSIFGVLALSSFLLEPWTEYAPLAILGMCSMIIFSSVGVMVGDFSE